MKLIGILCALMVMGACAYAYAEQPTTLPTTRPITNLDQVFDAIPRDELPLRVDPPLADIEKATRLARPLKGRIINFRIKPTAVEKTDKGWMVKMENTEYVYADKQIWLTMTCIYPLNDEATASAFKVGEPSPIAAVINTIEFDRWKKQLRLVLGLHPAPDPAIGH